MSSDLEVRLADVLKRKADVDSKRSVAEALLKESEARRDAVVSDIKTRFNMTPEELRAHVADVRPKVEAELTRLEGILKGI